MFMFCYVYVLLCLYFVMFMFCYVYVAYGYVLLCVCVTMFMFCYFLAVLFMFNYVSIILER